MDKKDRRTFLKVSAAAAGAAFGSFGFKARAELAPGRIRIGHIADPFFLEADDPKRSDKAHPGWLYGYAFRITDDIVRRLKDDSADRIVISGSVFKNERKPYLGKTVLGQWEKQWGIPFESTWEKAPRIESAGGFRIIMFDDYSGRGLAREDAAQWLADALSEDKDKPAILVTRSPLIETGKDHGRGRTLIELVTSMLSEAHQVVLVLSGDMFANRAGYVSGTSALNLVTCSPTIYPCGGRLVDLEVGPGAEIKVSSRFVQTRELELSEMSFHQAEPRSLIKNLGKRADRTFIAMPGPRTIEPVVYTINPSLAPVWAKDDLTMAHFTDTHVCLDEYLSESDRSDNKLIGHFNEKGSRAVFDDCLSQVSAGRHRIEFYDEVFAKDPEADGNYMEMKVDGVLMTGDLFDHGVVKEATVVRDRLDALPGPLRDKTFVTFGNHDRYRKDFSPDGVASGGGLISDFFKDYVRDDTTYVLKLNDWATMIVLDSTIPSHTPLGVIQDRIDWLEDEIAARSNEAIIIACHHPLYQLTLVPPGMVAYLRHRSHFTPKHGGIRTQLHSLFARSKNVKLILTGHYHGVVTDQFKKTEPAGPLPDDRFTTHIQTPCTVEYPAGYRLFRLSRDGGTGRIEYFTAYTRLHDLRFDSSRATLFRIFGTNARPTRRYQKNLERISRQENFNGDLARLNPYDLIDFNVRGFKDGTARRGRGNTGKHNIAGKIEFSL